MIRLTMIEGDALYVSPELITGVYDGGEATSLFIGGEEAFSVRESPQEVARKVLEYKLGMIQYQTYLADDTRRRHWEKCKDAAAVLKQLAGLEDTNDA